ncbi:DUF2164 domain-containing protein [Psychromonas sp. KJ10-2]|uniref:DUF2164 domain-containing protein n=1 Tax=Psychromonas sp. KJ10-2 TaxID=3391822 RepID=UPI0039B6B480
MAEITFSSAQKAAILEQIQAYFEKELDQELGQFDAEFLLDFFSEKMGGYYYNQGLNDARTLLDDKLDAITESFYELEKVTEITGKY